MHQIINEKVREFSLIGVDDMQKKANAQYFLRQALLDVAQQVRLDTLEEVEKKSEELETVDVRDLLSHIASLKQQPL